MIKPLWIIISVIVFAYVVNSYVESNARKEAESIAATERKEKIENKVTEMVGRSNANIGWVKELAKGKRHRFEPILSVELENLWIGDRPILFGGAIDDISTVSNTKYRIVLSRNIYSDIDKAMFGTKLLLDLECDKSLVDSVLQSHPELFENLGWNNGVAVIAKINKIRADSKIGEDGEKMEIRVGQGACLDIIYTGSVGI